MSRERTFVFLKPDAVSRGLVGAITKRFEDKGLKIVALRMLKVDDKLAADHYAVHEGKPFYEPLVEYVKSGPVVAMVLEGQGAIAQTRALLGATNPAEGRPGEIRFDYGQEIGRNLVHGSDGPDTAASEIALWFTEDDFVDYARTDDAWLFE